MVILKKSLTQIALAVAIILGLNANAFAQSDKIEGLWFNDNKDAKIQIYKGNDGRYYGKIIWLKEPLKNGKPKVDDKNPKSNLQNQPIVGLVILKSFQKDEDNTYTNGTIYDPQ